MWLPCDAVWNFLTKLFEILSIGRKPIPHLGEGETLCHYIHAVISVNKRDVLQTHCMWFLPLQRSADFGISTLVLGSRGNRKRAIWLKISFFTIFDTANSIPCSELNNIPFLLDGNGNFLMPPVALRDAVLSSRFTSFEVSEKHS